LGTTAAQDSFERADAPDFIEGSRPSADWSSVVHVHVICVPYRLPAAPQPTGID
jgi:hypothetical protein